jgi:hypothetical protein
MAHDNYKEALQYIRKHLLKIHIPFKKYDSNSRLQ